MWEINESYNVKDQYGVIIDNIKLQKCKVCGICKTFHLYARIA